MSAMTQVPCDRCGEPTYIVPIAGVTAGVCEKCIEVEHQRKRQTNQVTTSIRSWDNLTQNFKRYMHTDWHKLPCQYASGRAIEWRPDEEKTSLNLWGVPRTGKTRTMIEILRREYDYGKTFRVFGPADFALTIASLGFKADEWVKGLRKADLIAFDDIDKLRLSPVQEGQLFGLIEHFIACQKPIIMTHNSDAFALTRRFKCGEALVGRIKDSSLFKSVHFALPKGDER